MHHVNKKRHFKIETESFIAIDPGLNGTTGYAIFHPSLYKKPVSDGIITKARKASESWIVECQRIAYDIKLMAKPCDEAFIEMPEFWAGNAKSYTATAQGDLFKLAFLVGSITQELSSVLVDVTLLAPRQWKGQLKKEMVDRRIAYILHRKYPNHVSDAVGIGLYVLGLL